MEWTERRLKNSTREIKKISHADKQIAIKLMKGEKYNENREHNIFVRTVNTYVLQRTRIEKEDKQTRNKSQ